MGQHALEQKQGSASQSRAAEPASKLTALQSSMQQKLVSSRFRHLNQTLYTTPSEASMALFHDNPAFFQEYHEGFRRQVAAWPQNPIEGFITWLKVRGAAASEPKAPHKRSRPFKHPGSPPAVPIAESERHDAAVAAAMGPLPRNYHNKGLCTIADLGCGDAQLAKTLRDPPPKPTLSKLLKLHVRSFDLSSHSPHVEVADISALPLAPESVDVAIFCLALMGTNWISFVEEAYRILRWRGECWISEVSSRFIGSPAKGSQEAKKEKKSKDLKRKKATKEEDPLEGEDFSKVDELGSPRASTDVSAFVGVLRRRGFELMGEPEMDNKMFVRMRFVKSLRPVKGKVAEAKTTVDGFQKAKKRFLPTKADDIEVDEAQVLKPCVYKQR